MGRLVLLASLPLRLLAPALGPGVPASELVFRTAPSVSKVEVKRFLEAVYGLPVQKVTTANYAGKKKRAGIYGFRMTSAWKKVWVTLREPVLVPDTAYLGPPPDEAPAGKAGATAGKAAVPAGKAAVPAGKVAT